MNVKEEPVSNTVSASSVGGVGMPSGMMGSAASSGVSTTGFASMEFQTRSKCFMWMQKLREKGEKKEYHGDLKRNEAAVDGFSRFYRWWANRELNVLLDDAKITINFDECHWITFCWLFLIIEMLATLITGEGNSEFDWNACTFVNSLSKKQHTHQVASSCYT